MRNVIVALLVLGPQYGLQLRTEYLRRVVGLSMRVPNSGQLYQTLERLVRDGLVQKIIKQQRDFPSYALTAVGEAAADRWLSTPDEQAAASPWDTMLLQVIVARSIDPQKSVRLVSKYLDVWRHKLASLTAQSQQSLLALGQQAELKQAEVAVEWLLMVERTPPVALALSLNKPARGRPRKN